MAIPLPTRSHIPHKTTGKCQEEETEEGNRPTKNNTVHSSLLCTQSKTSCKESVCKYYTRHVQIRLITILIQLGMALCRVENNESCTFILRSLRDMTSAWVDNPTISLDWLIGSEAIKKDFPKANIIRCH